MWVLCGRDRPELGGARYLDPVEYVKWAMADDGRLPESLVGRSHGDLHARNVLVGVRRGEAEYPVAFDYGEMGTANVLAWDFAKMEAELVRRHLPPLVADPAVRDALATASRLRPKVIADVASTDLTKRQEVEGRREFAERLRAYLTFFELLDGLTAAIQSKAAAEALDRSVTVTPLERVNRLLFVLRRVRAEAALWLGFSRDGRKGRWRDELYFALAVHGLLNVRWEYEEPEVEAALVAAGVAIARMPATPRLLARAAEPGPTAAGPFPSYRVPLHITHQLWKGRKHADAVRFVEREVVEPPSNPPGDLIVRPAARHAVPLIAEALLMQMEVGKAGAIEKQLDEQFRPLAREFGDYETLGRVGRLLKDAGDRAWEESGVTFDAFHSTIGWQMYQKAWAVYDEAYRMTGDWYVCINAATLALLTHKHDRAKELADQLAATLATLHDHAKDDRYWLFATEGEAALLRGRPRENGVPDAIDYYRGALAELTPGQGGMADSSYKQLCRLWKALGEPRVGPILELFERSQFGPVLTCGYMGRTPASPPESNTRPEIAL